MDGLTVRAASTAAAAALVAIVVQAAASARFVPDWDEALQAIPVAICCDPPTPAPVDGGCCAPQWFEAVEAQRKNPGRSLPSGRVLLRCAIDERDRLVNCTIQSEEPEGAGLGDVPIRVVEGEHAPTLAGERRSGGGMDIPVRFRFSAQPYGPSAN